MSFYNETEGVTVNPSPVIGVAGIMDIKDIRTMNFKNKGDKIILIGTTYPELDGSQYHKEIFDVVQGKSPKVNMDAELESVEAVLKIIHEDENDAVTAVHDCSAGGIAIAVAEMAISGDLGAAVDTSKVPKEDNMSDVEVLFSESNARFIVTVKSEYANEILSKIDAPAAVIGEVGGKTLTVNQNLVNIDIEKLKKSYYGVIEKFMA